MKIKDILPPRIWFDENLEDNFCGHKAPEKFPIQYISFQEHQAITAKLVSVLELYADPFSWRTKSGKVGITALTDGTDFEMIDGQMTGGKLARQALKLWRGEKE